MLHLYKVYFDYNIQSRTNTTESFEGDLMTMNGSDKPMFFDSYSAAIDAYNSINIDRATKHSNIYRAEGKLMEVIDIDVDDYNDALAHDMSIEDIFDECSGGDIKLMSVSDPYKEET